MRLALAALAVFIILLATTSAEAAGRRRPGAPNRYYQNAANARAVYPQYYWGLNARDLQNIGIPTGDIGPGTRGNSIMLNPW